MKNRKFKEKYRCRIFLKDEKDMKLLTSGTRLYGETTDSTGIVFMTPYKPPGNNLRWIGIVQEPPVLENENPLLINVYVENGSITASGFFNNQHTQIPVDIVYTTANYERTPFKQSELDILWNKKMLIFGSGTGGSKIALELARAGVGNITLCDPERLEFANISRHEGDMLDVGKPKTQVVAERIYRVNPAIQICSYFEDIFDRSLYQVKEIFCCHDLVVAATDSRSVQLLINEFTHKFDIPCVFGGCYEEARGGEVFFTLPGEKMPCLACLRGGIKQPERKNDIDYSTATGPEDYQGQPGLHAAVDFITCIEVQICLGILLKESKTSKLAQMIDPARNFILIGGALAKGFYRFRKPFDIFYQPLSDHRKNCSVCQPNWQIGMTS
jgi:molybdopterin/thiamine biosynthesis adenylyltransferase